MKKAFEAISDKWHHYKYRFVPWQILNWQNKRTTIRRIEESIDFKVGQEDEICESIKCLFGKFDEAEKTNDSIDDILFKSFGFNLEKRESSIEGAGDGIFVSKGSIPENSIAAMYPGTIYYPSEPLLLQSINNPFILRCIDGIMIDGNHKGISNIIYRSCCGRDMIGRYKPCDMTWLIDASKNPLAVGQFVNNQTTNNYANVAYQEINIPISFPLHLRKYLPNIYYRNKFLDDSFDFQENQILMRLVVLLSLSNISVNEELFSAYFTEVF